MTRARRALVGAALVGISLLGVSPAGASGTVRVDDAGWWSRAAAEPALGVVASPDVPEGSLLVEGTPEGATALAAVRATLPNGSTAPVLTITPSSAVGLDASSIFLACQAGSGWTGVHGGDWNSKPSPDCAQSVQGIVGDDGTVTFPLSALQFGDQVNVVLVPGVDPDGVEGFNGSAFRVVFPTPTAAELTVTEAPRPTDPPVTPAPPVSQYTPPPAPSVAPTTTRPTSSFSAPTAPTAEQLAAQPVQAALPATEQGRTATAPILTAATPAAVPSPADSADNTRWFGLALVLAAGAGLVWITRQPVPERRVLSRFASGPVTVEAASPVAEAKTPLWGRSDGPQVGGLGRFRRVRDTPARRLGT